MKPLKKVLSKLGLIAEQKLEIETQLNEEKQMFLEDRPSEDFEDEH